MTTIFHPDLVYDGRDAHAGWGVLTQGGRIVAVGPRDSLHPTSASGAATEEADTVPLPGRAVMAAPVNVHSHAFQRDIRGRTQTRPTARPDADFWSWRNEMYARALTMDPDAVHLASKACFAEMRAAGWGSVGEFHYLHRAPDGSRYDDPLRMSDAVIEAARAVGLPICLLYVAYATSDVDGAPLGAMQRRFAADDLDEVLRAVDELNRRWAGDPRVTVGLAPHSVRAVPESWWTPLAEAAAALDVPLHAHVSEQRLEVERCLAVHGRRPVEFLADRGVLSSRFTAVHATHLSDGEVELLAGSGSSVCACPSTERDLGDGVLPAHRLAAAGVPICLGSDSHTLLDPWEELRLPEYHLRLVEQRRIVLGEDDDGVTRWAPAALRMATSAGGASLRTGAGRIAPGAPADLVSIDLAHPALHGLTPERFPEAVAVSGRAGIAEPLDCGLPPVD